MNAEGTRRQDDTRATDLHGGGGALLQVVAVCVIWSVAGCAIFLDEETRYLRSAQNHATQQEVRNRLGGPMWIMSSRTGETVWVYQIRQPEKAATIFGPSPASGAMNMC